MDFWSVEGKTDKIEFREAGTDWIDINHNYTSYGREAHTGETLVLSCGTTYFDVSGEGKPFEGESRFVLMQGDRIIEQYPAVKLRCEDGRFASVRTACFIQVPVGKYTAVPLFRKSGEDKWFKCTSYFNNAPIEEWEIEVLEKTDFPLLRMLSLENQISIMGLVYDAPEKEPFNLVYTIANPSLKPMKGNIRICWEREFKLHGNTYYPSMKRPNCINDVEFSDILGETDIDVNEGVRYWKGILSCSLPVERKHVGVNPESGNEYNSAKALVYFKPDGSDKWSRLRLEADYLLNRNYSGNDIWDECQNYLCIRPVGWR